MPVADAAPALHLLKMAVGIADLDELRAVRARRIAQLGGSWVYTRNHPRRADELAAGGSLYWVIRGLVRVRQRLTGFAGKRDDNGRAYCLIGVDPELVATVPRSWRPFQGWRYLTAADAPPDAPQGWREGAATDGEMPPHLVAELRSLGLL
jgi:hypothetical protein